MVTYEVIPSMDAPPDTLPSGSGGANWADAASRGVATLLPPGIALGQYFGLKHEIDVELARMSLDLKKAKGNKRGVLTVAEVKEWLTPHDAGRARSLHTILIGPAGNDMNEAVHRWRTHDHMFAGVPKGWRLSAIYLWVTAP